MSDENSEQSGESTTALAERPSAWMERAQAVPMNGGLVVPQNLQQLHDYAAVLVKTGSMRGFQVPDAVLALQRGAEMGFTLTVAAMAFYPAPGGRMGIYAEAALALLRGKGILDGDRIEYTGTGEDLTAIWHFRRASWPKDRWEKSTFSVREARVAQLVKRDSNWDKWPKRMTLWRAIGFACKDYFSDILFGFEIGEPAANGRTEPAPPGGYDGPPRPPAPTGDDPLKAMALEGESYVVDGEKVTEPPSTGEDVPPEPHRSDEERLLRLNSEILARTQGDVDARRALLKEIASVADTQGVDAAERALIEHDVFGGPIQGELT